MDGGRRGVVAAVAALIVVAVAGIVGIRLLTDDGGSPNAAPTSTTTPPERTGPCDSLDPDTVDAALGGPGEVDVAGATRCTLGRPGTLVLVEVEQTSTDATAADLDAVERRGGPDPAAQEPWPEEAVDDLGDGAVWLTDPAGDGSYGELWVRSGARLVRITVSTPPDHRREPLTIATGVATAALDDLEPL